MANYRLVSVHIWNDPDFENLTPSEKTIFLYLITNNATTDSGIYTVTPKKIANDTNVQLGTVNKLLSNCKNLSYDFDNKEDHYKAISEDVTLVKSDDFQDGCKYCGFGEEELMKSLEKCPYCYGEL